MALMTKRPSSTSGDSHSPSPDPDQPSPDMDPTSSTQGASPISLPSSLNVPHGGDHDREQRSSRSTPARSSPNDLTRSRSAGRGGCWYVTKYYSCRQRDHQFTVFFLIRTCRLRRKVCLLSLAQNKRAVPIFLGLQKCDEERVDGDSCKTCKRLGIKCLGWGPRRPDWMRVSSMLTFLSACCVRRLTLRSDRARIRTRSINTKQTSRRNSLAQGSSGVYHDYRWTVPLPLHQHRQVVAGL